MKKALKFVVVTVFLLVLVVSVGGYFVLANMDFNQYKGKIIEIVYNATGRELKIGDIQVKASFNPTIEIKDIELANASWGQNQEMFSAKEIDLGVAIMPLLRKKFVIDTFVLRNSAVNLEENANGDKNWVFDMPKNEDEEKVKTISYYPFSLVKTAQADELEQRNDTAELLSAFVFKKVLLENVKINYLDKSKNKMSYDIKSLGLTENDDENIDFSFDVNNGLYQGKGIVGALNLLESKQGYPMKADVVIDGIKLSLDAKVFDMFNNLSFDAQVEAKNFLEKNSGYDERALVGLKGNVSQIEAVIKEFVVAGNKVLGDVVVDLSQSKVVVDANLNSDKIDIDSFSKKEKTAYLSWFVNDAHASTMVSNSIIPFGVLQSINADIKIGVVNVTKKKDVLARNVKLNTVLKNGKGNVSLSSDSFVNGLLKADVNVLSDNRSVKLKVDAKQVDLKKVLEIWDTDSDIISIGSGGLSDIYVALVGSGNTYNDVFSSLDGSVIMIVNQSDLHIGNIGVLKGNILSQLLDTLKLTKGNDNLDLRCAVVRSDVKNGVAEFPNGIALNADKFTIVADGNVNLKNDKIKLSIKPFAGKITDTNIAKALSSLVQLTGTMQNPKIGIDGTNAIKTIVGVTTTGPVYLGAQMLLENDGSPCYTALKGTEYENMFPKSQNVVNDVNNEVNNILDGGVDAVKNTTKGILNILTGGNK